MYVFTFMYMYIYTHIQIYMYIFTYVYKYVYMNIYVYMCIYTYIHTYIHTYIYICICDRESRHEGWGTHNLLENKKRKRGTRNIQILDNILETSFFFFRGCYSGICEKT